MLYRKVILTTVFFGIFTLALTPCWAQLSPGYNGIEASSSAVEQMKDRINELEAKVAELKRLLTIKRLPAELRERIVRRARVAAIEDIDDVFRYRTDIEIKDVVLGKLFGEDPDTVEKDEGELLDEETLDSVFDRAYRASSGRRERPERGIYCTVAYSYDSQTGSKNPLRRSSTKRVKVKLSDDEYRLLKLSR